MSPAEAQRILDDAEFCRWWGFQVDAVQPGRATVRLPFKPHLLRPGGVLHGASYAALADVAFWVAMIAADPAAHGARTLEMKTNFLDGAAGELRCDARILRAGRRITYGEARTTDIRQRLVAHHTLTYIQPTPSAPPTP
jgi:uncharacterized protein (TIGR00369 family)